MSILYPSAERRLQRGELSLASDTVRAALVSYTPAYTPDPVHEKFVADVFDGTTAAEFTGTGYSRQTVTHPGIAYLPTDGETGPTQDDSDDNGDRDGNAFFVGDSVTFANIDGDTIQGVLLYKQVGNDDTTPEDDPLVAYFTSTGFPLHANGSNVTIEFSVAGHARE